ncbi:PTS transporter subunit EIIC [Candidatus Ventrimonas sp. KK005]
MAKKSKYENLVNSVVGLMGGKDNIAGFTHCVTRLRFNVKDKNLVKAEELEKTEGVVGCQWSGEQFQIIIGQAVGDVYGMICDKEGFAKKGEVKDENDTPKKKMGIGLLFENIAGCMIPLLPMFIGVGMVKVLLTIFSQTGLLGAESPTYQFLTFASDAGFYFLPIFAGMTSAKKFGASPALGMLLGAMLIHPTFVGLVAEGTPAAIFGITVYPGTYTSSIFPSIVTVYVMSKIEKFLRKYIPELLRTFAVPLLTILIMIPIMFCITAPIGSVIGTYLAVAIQWGNDVLGPIGIAILAAIFPFLVLTGMHTALIPYGVQAFTSLGYLPNAICTLSSNINQGAATAAVAVKTKNKQLRATALSCTTTAVIAGVTEPAMFGVNLRYKTPMIGVVVGSFASGLFAGFFRVYAYSFGTASGIFSFPGYMGGPGVSNVVFAVLSCVIGFAVTFIVTYILYKDEAEVN